MKALLFLALVYSAAAAAQTAPLAVGDHQPDCEVGSKVPSCEHHIAQFTKPAGQNGTGNRALIFQELNTYGPSVNFGNAGGWTVTQLIGAPHITFGTSGIDQYMGASMTKNGTGDLAGLYLYVYGGGRAAQSDEGVTGATIESGEIAGYFHGTIASGGETGATSLNLTNNASAPHAWANTCNGCMLLDISKGTIAGNLNGKNFPVAGTYLRQLPTVGDTINGSPSRLPLTKAWCTTTAAIPATATAGQGTLRTVNCSLGKIGNATPTFQAGGLATIAGMYYPEQVVVTEAGPAAGGVQALTFAARNPNPAGSILFQGGIAGQSLSFDDNLAYTGFRTSYYVFGSLDGINLIYGSQIAGHIDLNHELPRAGSDAETISSGFHLYPSAEIVANTAQPSAPMLEPNAVSWQNGDLVENPRFQSYGGIGLRDVCSAYTPSDEGVAAGCFRLQMEGPGVAGTYHPFVIANYNHRELYTQAGGKFAPVPAVWTDGTFGDLLVFNHGPSIGPQDYNSIINVAQTASEDNTPFNLFALPTGRTPGTTKVTYDPATHLIGFPQGVVTAKLGTMADCVMASPSVSCGQAAAGSIVIQPGSTSIAVGTDKVTAASEILITPDTTLGAKLGITCNQNLSTAFAPYGITARVPGRGFTLSVANAASAPNCYSFTIIN